MVVFKLCLNILSEETPLKEDKSVDLHGLESPCVMNVKK